MVNRNNNLYLPRMFFTFVGLVLPVLLSAETFIGLSTGEIVQLKEDNTWHFVDAESHGREPLLNVDYDGVLVSVDEARIINTFSDNQEAGVRFILRNNSDRTVSQLRVTVYYLNNSGSVFFEQPITLVSDSSFSSPNALRPNYSLRVPDRANSYTTARGIILEDWDEGKVRLEVTRIEFAESERD